MTEHFAMDSVESIDLNQLLESAFSPTGLTLTNDDSADTVTVTLVSNKDPAPTNTNVVRSLVWRNDIVNPSNVSGSTPKNVGCSCVEYECAEKIKILRLRQRRIMQRKNYLRKSQHNLITFMKTTHFGGNDVPSNLMTNLQTTSELQTTLPMALSATQRNLEKNRHRPCLTALLKTTYVIRQEYDKDDYVTNCQCLNHECQKNLKVLFEFHQSQNERKNCDLIQGDKFIEQLERLIQTIHGQLMIQC